jgi:hypothetical protein
MILISGIVLIVLSCGLLFYSLPRGGRVARFVGTQWEPYVTILIICLFGLGALLAVAGVTDVLEVSYDG